MLSKSMRKLITLIIAVIVALVLMRWLTAQTTETVRLLPDQIQERTQASLIT